MPELSKLTAQRGQQKSALTRIKKFIESLDMQNITQKTHFEIKARLERLQKINERFEDIQDQIELSLNGKSEEVDYRAEFEEVFYSLHAEMETLLQISSETESRSSRDEINHISHADFSHKGVKLPTIELPTFDGQFKDSITYRDLFKSLVHNQRHLSNIEKFHYLKASLKGEALCLIQPIQISEENYEVAFNILSERYDKLKLLIHHHLKLIFDTPVIFKESLKELRKLTDDFRGNVSIMINLGIDTSSWDTLLLYLISTKLDISTQTYGYGELALSVPPKLPVLRQQIHYKCNLSHQISDVFLQSQISQNVRFNSSTFLNLRF